MPDAEEIPVDIERFRLDFAEEIALAKELYERYGRAVPRGVAPFRPFEHYERVAAYLNELRTERGDPLDKHVIVAGLLHGLSYKKLGGVEKSVLRRLGYDAKQIVNLLHNYHRIHARTDIDINAWMIAHMQLPEIRASLIRAVDVMLNLPERAEEEKKSPPPGPTFLQLAEDIYLRVSLMFGLHRLHKDIGLQVMRVRHASRLKEIEEFIEQEGRRIHTHGVRSLARIRSLLEERLGLKYNVDYNIIPRPEAYEHPRLAPRRFKSPYWIHVKLLTKPGRETLENIPDIAAWRIVLNTRPDATEAERRDLVLRVARTITENVSAAIREISDYTLGTLLGYRAYHIPLVFATGKRAGKLAGTEIQVTTGAWQEHNELGAANPIFGKAANFPPEIRQGLTVLSNDLRAGVPPEQIFRGELEPPVHVLHEDKVFSLPEGSAAIDLWAERNKGLRGVQLPTHAIINGETKPLTQVLSSRDTVTFEYARREAPDTVALHDAAYLPSTREMLRPHLPPLARARLRFRRL